MTNALAVLDGPEVLRRPGVTVLDGPTREGSELRWIVSADGERRVVAMLVPELARDESLRRRWVRDVERLAAMTDVAALLPIVELGPAPDPRDPSAAPPFRVRAEPEPAESFDAWLSRRAPVAVDEAAEIVASIADAVHEFHRHGAVLRDLHPRRILLADEGGPEPRVRLGDVGLTRIDLLSTRTAASLVLEGSPYASPEQFTKNTVDQRSDVYGLGVLLFRALTGTLPFGEEPAILRPPGAKASAAAVRGDRRIDAELDALVTRCLDDDPTRRPGSAAELARALRGDATGTDLPAATAPCQSCGRNLRPGQRLCIHCGKEAVRFRLATPDETAYDVVLQKVSETEEALGHLRKVLSTVGAGELPALNLLHDDQRMYSKAEQKRLLRLPQRLFSGLDAGSAEALAQQLTGPAGLKVVTREHKEGGLMPARARRVLAGLTAGWIAIVLAALATGAWAILPVSTIAIGIIALVVVVRMRRSAPNRSAPMMALRTQPAALPASDPLVARLAALLHGEVPADLRDQVGVLALGVQRLVDHRAANLAEAAEIDAVTEPVAELVTLVEAQVRRIAEIDAELATLDEATIVRALPAAATETDRDELLTGLDRLRSLEDARSAAFHRLLEAGALIRRAVELGMSVRDEGAAQDREVNQALALLAEPS